MVEAYLLNGSYLNASQKSGILYVEISSDSNKVVKRISLPVYGGIAYGQISLEEKEFSQGGYILRAYTNWMEMLVRPVFLKSLFILDMQM